MGLDYGCSIQHQKDRNTIVETLNIEKLGRFNWIETQSNCKRETTHPNHTGQRLKQEKNWCRHDKENPVLKDGYLLGTKTGKLSRETQKNYQIIQIYHG